MTLGDRIVVMKDGRIQQADTPLETYNLPANRFVAGFIGMPPMNFFEGSIKQSDGQLFFEEGKLQNARIDGAAAIKTAKGKNDEPVVLVGELTLPGNGFTLAVPQRLHDVLADRIGRHVVLGIRPEHLQLRPGDGQSAVLEAQLNVVEPLGNDMDLYLSTSLHDYVVGRVEAQSGLNVNQRVKLHVDLRKIHFFDPGETGMNLGLCNQIHHAIA